MTEPNSVPDPSSTPATSQPSSPKLHAVFDSKMATPHPSPTSDDGELPGSAADPMSASWLTASSVSKSRSSPMPPPSLPSSAFAAGTSLPGPAFANHHRYRTSVHESSLPAAASSLRSTASRASFHENRNSLGSSTPEELAEAHARHIVATRWAKRQTWGSNLVGCALLSADLQAAAWLTTRLVSPQGPSSMPANPRSKSSSLLEAVDLSPSIDHRLAGVGDGRRPTGSSSALATPRDDLNWVNLDFSAEVERLQQAKAHRARTDMNTFSMPLKPPAADEPGIFTESPQGTSDTTPDDAASPALTLQAPVTLPAEPIVTDFAPSISSSSTANSLSRASGGGSSTGNHHRRSLSLRSSLGSSLGKAPFSLDAGKSSPQRMSTLFAQPRVVSSSSTLSRESVDQRPRRNISAKIDGWWKSVVGNIGSLNTSAVKPPHHHSTVSHHHLPLPKPTNLPRVPPPVAGAAPSSLTPTIGFAPVANPVPAAATTSLKHATSLHELANPSPMPPPVRPIRAHTEFGPLPVARQSSRSSMKTIPAPSAPSSEQSLDARRRQPALHLRLSQRQGSSATIDSPSESSSGAERGSSSRPPLRSSASRSSSFGTADESPEHSSRRVRTVSDWGQSPGALYAVLADDGNETPPLGYDELAVTSREFNKPAVNRQVKAKVAAEKKDCDRRLKKIIHEITVFVERKLEEANRGEDLHDIGSALLASAMDSQSDVGGDETVERYEVPPMRRREFFLETRVTCAVDLIAHLRAISRLLL